jgi:hypothetical protein
MAQMIAAGELIVMLVETDQQIVDHIRLGIE